MITVTKYPCGFSVDGHAGHGERGKDIVCAAISALTESFISSWDKLSDDMFTLHYGAGDVKIEYDTELSDVSKTLISSFFIGVEGVCDIYPENVKLIDMTNT